MNNKPWIRLVLAVSIDGRLAFSNGGKDNLGGEGDRKVLEKALAWCDGTLMGSGTLKTHENTCLIHNLKLIDKRLEAGLPAQPTSIIVSKDLSFSKTLDFFKQPIKKYLLTPKSNSEKGSNKIFDKVLLMRGNWLQSLQELNKEGFSKITLLGGTKLITSLFLEDVIDELQLTFTPRLLGGEYTWTSHKVNKLPSKLNKPNAWILMKTEDLGNNELMIKYIRNRT